MIHLPSLFACSRYYNLEGAMITAAKEGTVDIILALTEGLVAGIAIRLFSRDYGGCDILNCFVVDV